MTRADATSGSALVEALAAMTLVAVAGAVVAAAAMCNLRALHTAALVERLVAIASRELASVQARGAPEMVDDTILDELGTGVPVDRRLVVTRSPEGVATLTATISAPAAPPVTLTTRMLVAE